MRTSIAMVTLSQPPSSERNSARSGPWSRPCARRSRDQRIRFRSIPPTGVLDVVIVDDGRPMMRATLTRATALLIAASVGGLSLLATAGPADAHEKWFVDDA